MVSLDRILSCLPIQTSWYTIIGQLTILSIILFISYHMLSSLLSSNKRKEPEDYVPSSYTGDIVILHQSIGGYEKCNGSMSPFCLKLEAFLRFTGIPYTNGAPEKSNPRHAPKGKIPYIEHKGLAIGDSSIIIEYLEQEFANRLGDKYLPHSELTKEEQSVGVLLQRTIEEHFYFFFLFSRWAHNDENYKIYLKLLLAPLGKFIVWMVCNVPFIRKKIQVGMRTVLENQGMGKHSSSRVVKQIKQDLEAIEGVLKGKKYLFSNGEFVTSYDATCYATLCNIIYGPDLEYDFGMRDYIATQHPQLVDYVKRIKAEYFTDASIVYRPIE